MRRLEIEFPIWLEASLDHLEAFRVDPGLPATVIVDAQGRVWVVEAVNYRLFKHPIARPEGDRIRVLEDTDGDALSCILLTAEITPCSGSADEFRAHIRIRLFQCVGEDSDNSGQLGNAADLIDCDRHRNGV